MSEKEKQLEFGNDLIAAVMESFKRAYVMHKHGESETALLITYDIFAAGSDFAPEVVRAHRAAISSAVTAVDRGVPYHFAQWFMERQLRNKMTEVLGDET